MKREEFMREAIRLSQEHMQAWDGGPFGCVIVKDGEIVGRGWNKVTSSNDPTAHAEVVAIRDACQALGSFQLDGCELYTSCEPCPMCLGAIYWARPKKVYYACDKVDAANANFDDQFIYEELDKKHEDRQIKFVKIIQNEGQYVFDKWKKLDNKTDY